MELKYLKLLSEIKILLKSQQSFKSDRHDLPPTEVNKNSMKQ